MARHDGLTDLPTARCLRAAGDPARRLHLHGGACAVLFLDLEPLQGRQTTASATRPGISCPCGGPSHPRWWMRAEDMVARLGGDEFAVLVADAGDPAHAETLAARLIAAVQAPIRIGKAAAEGGPERRHRAGAPATVPIARRCSGAPISLSAGRRRRAGTPIGCSSPRWTRPRRPARPGTGSAPGDRGRRTHPALPQPQVSTPPARLLGFEALVRWSIRPAGWCRRMPYIPLAEESDLILLLGDGCCAPLPEAARWSRPLKVAVNLSPRPVPAGGSARAHPGPPHRDGPGADAARTRDHRDPDHQRHGAGARHPASAEGLRHLHRDG